MAGIICSYWIGQRSWNRNQGYLDVEGIRVNNTRQSVLDREFYNWISGSDILLKGDYIIVEEIDMLIIGLEILDG